MAYGYFKMSTNEDKAWKGHLAKQTGKRKNKEKVAKETRRKQR